MTYDNRNGTVDAPVSISRIVGLIIAIIVVAGVMVPVCDAARHDRVSEDNEGILCAEIGAGYTATATASETEQYALIGDTVAIVLDGDNLHAYGIGINEVAESFAISYDGTVLTIGSVSIPCAWAFVPSDTGDFRYGDEGATLSIDDVYGAGTSGDVYFSIHGASSVKVGGIA